MISNKELKAGAKAIADDFRLPDSGRRKLSELIAGHLGWFEAAERRGMSWGDMAKSLAAAGVTGKGGKPLTIGTLSSTVWRERAIASGTIPGPQRRERLAPPLAAASAENRLEERRSRRGRVTRKSKPARGPSAHDEGPRRVVMPPSPPMKPASTQSNKDVLAFMNRAQAVRRRSE